MLCVKNLSLKKTKQKKEFLLLDDITIEIEKERITLLLGKSGSGKTSLLRCIAQLEKDYIGTVDYDGKGMQTFSHRERSQIVGFVAQNYALFPFMTVLDNCAHPLRKVLGKTKKEAYEKVRERLASLEMLKYQDTHPYELSGGQQQRVAIVRALVLDPVFLLFDEPTSALDPENTDLLVKIILKLKSEGKGIVIASQDMAFASKILDQVYFLEDGKFVETHDTILQGKLGNESKILRFLTVD